MKFEMNLQDMPPPANAAYQRGDFVRHIRTGVAGKVEWVIPVVNGPNMVGYKTDAGDGLIADEPSLEWWGQH